MKYLRPVLFLGLVSLVNLVESFGTGAPAGACGTLSPDPTRHGADPQTTPVPYEVDLSALRNGTTNNYCYVPGETYELTVRSTTPGMTFRGVLLQGRLVADDVTPAGTFTVTDDNTRLSSCTPPEISVTHSNGNDKTSITTNWTAPAMGTGDVIFGFAVVQVRVTYWANQRTGPISEGSTTTCIGPTTTLPPTDTQTTEMPTSRPGNGMGGDPHFSIMLPTKQQLCYSIQGESGFTFNLISNELMQMNALFVADSKRKEVTWIGGLGIVVKNTPYKQASVTTLSFNAAEKSIHVGNDITLKGNHVKKLTFKRGKLTISESERQFNSTSFPIQINLHDIGLDFSVRFVKNNHIDMKWDNVVHQSRDSHGLIGQFFRKGVDIDEARRLLQLPNMQPVPVMRKPIWHFMEQETPDEQLCWVAMNPGYQGKKLIEGSYLDYVVDDLLSMDFNN